MEVISTNIGPRKSINWKGKTIETGIFKTPVDQPIFLDVEDVRDDEVVDRRFHGGINKACYLYSTDHYDFWKNLYPNLNWNYGMFGENLSITGLKEEDMIIGSVYRLGESLVQITQPREPCFKLGIKFGTQKILKQFIDANKSGVYVKVLHPGNVKKGDKMFLQEFNKGGISIKEMYTLLFHQNEVDDFSTKALQDPLITDSNRKRLKFKFGL